MEFATPLAINCLDALSCLAVSNCLLAYEGLQQFGKDLFGDVLLMGPEITKRKRVETSFCDTASAAPFFTCGTCHRYYTTF